MGTAVAAARPPSSRSTATRILAAFGGDGAYASGSMGVGGLDGELRGPLHDGDAVQGPAANTGAGVISGTVTCETPDPVAPGTPELQSYVEVGNGTATFQFTPGSLPEDGNENTLDVDYEYKLDAGAWKPFTVGFTGSDDLTGTISGLTNLKKYSLTRPGDEHRRHQRRQRPGHLHALRPRGRPDRREGHRRRRLGDRLLDRAQERRRHRRTTWPSPSRRARRATASWRSARRPAPPAPSRSKAGRAYNVGVVSRDSLGNEGGRTFLEEATAVVPASAISATLPTSDGPLTSSETDGKVVAGSRDHHLRRGLRARLDRRAGRLLHAGQAR